MSRSLSLTLRRALNAQEAGEVPAWLLTITHPLLNAPIRLSSDPTVRLTEVPDITYGTVSRGEEYLFLPISFPLPDEKGDATPLMRLTIDNVGRELINILRSTTTPAQFRIEMVLASAPDEVEVELPLFDMVSVEYDAQQVTLTLALNGLTTEPFPSLTFSPAVFPGLF